MKIAASLFFIIWSQLAICHEDQKTPSPLPLEEYLATYNLSFNTTTIKVEPLTGNMYALYGLGGNILVSLGDNGVLLVDNQFAELIPKIQDAIKRLGGDKIDIVINTHWHFDHANGNLSLGSKDTKIIAHRNSRSMMKEDHIINLVNRSYRQTAYPEDALPDITYNKSMQLHYNNEAIDLVHFGSAHTTGDTVVIFRNSNVAHLGDIFVSNGYPFIDTDNGGNIEGVIRSCQSILKSINKNTTIIPGHGPVSSYNDLVSYTSMLITVHKRLSDLIKTGASLEQVHTANVTAEWDSEKGDNTVFIDRSYTSLIH